MKVNLILRFILTAICLQLTSCGYPETPMVKFKGPNDKMELVFFYKKDASYEQKELLQNTIVHKPDPEGHGYYLQEGVAGLTSVRNSSYEGYAIEFYPNATLDQRQNLKKAIESSPIVYKVYENVVPSEIKDL